MPALDELVGLSQNGRTRGELLAAMKDRGLTIAETIKASMELFEIELKEAKLLVTSDPSWIPTAQAAEPFQDELIQLFSGMESAEPRYPPQNNSGGLPSFGVNKMARRLEDRLQESGVEMDAGTFRTLLVDTLHDMYRNWSDEELMHRPTEALRYCQAIRQETAGYDLPDEVILRALSAMRKKP